MNKKTLGIILLVAAVGAGAYMVGAKNKSGQNQTNQDLPAYEYAYTCDSGDRFSMKPSEDMSAISFRSQSQNLPAEATLKFVNNEAGARFEGEGLVFVGAGETVTITKGENKITCNPAPSQDSPPWNFGDSGEGGGTKQDTVTIVSESIVGQWQSADDAKFTREFKTGGAVTDVYEGKTSTTGTWTVFTKEKPVAASFPLEENATYVRLEMSGTQKETLNFKVSRLTPEELELIYMDRGGTLKFKKYAGSAGTIQGTLGYPSEGVPAEIEVCAQNTQTQAVQCTGQTKEGGKAAYKIAVPAGTYVVYAKFPENSNMFKGYKAYYSEFVTCGLKAECQSHKPIEVKVAAGQTVSNIDPNDWYAQN